MQAHMMYMELIRILVNLHHVIHIPHMLGQNTYLIDGYFNKNTVCMFKVSGTSMYMVNICTPREVVQILCINGEKKQSQLEL